ncbi:hypothetical protein JRQ81_007994 [Phrynocephalus forsythii]|uniref:GIY-YIG domain-containing protein n=1 Tax=Phrynocephalus forsythii TaxID=171643 RepID=A0A9Q1ATS9_9SAUR|nr:hypothetical protein JRQ81_007994 [Phrynocephalus forsythii]
MAGNTPKNQETEENNGTALLPYIKGTTDKISKILHKHNIKTAFCTDRKIANILRNPKDKIELENQGVYEIPCKVCPATYIGQTNRRISARIAEHKNAHIKTTGHEIDFERTKLISKTEHFNSRIIMEAIEIEKHPNNMNKRDDTSRLPDIWKLALVNRRASVTKTDTRSKRTQDATTFHPHQTQTQTLPTDETKPPSNNKTTTAPSTAAPHSSHHMEHTHTPQKHWETTDT